MFAEEFDPAIGDEEGWEDEGDDGGDGEEGAETVVKRHGAEGGREAEGEGAESGEGTDEEAVDDEGPVHGRGGESLGTDSRKRWRILSFFKRIVDGRGLSGAAVVEPPFEHEDGDGEGGDPVPDFDVGLAEVSGGDFVEFAEVELFVGFGVAFGGVKQIYAEGDVVGADFEAVGALFGGVAEDDFAGVAEGQHFGGPAWEGELGGGGGFGEGVSERFAGADHELAGFGGGGVEPFDGVGDEHGEGDAEGPGALEGVEADPDDFLTVEFAGHDERGLLGFDERDGPAGGFDGDGFGDLDVVKCNVAQEGVGVAPIDGGGVLDGGPAGVEPVCGGDVEGEEVGFGPDDGGDVVKNNDVVLVVVGGEILDGSEGDIRDGVEGFFQEAVAAGDELDFDGAGEEADDGGLVVGGEVVFGIDADREDAVALLGLGEDLGRAFAGRDGEGAGVDDLAVEEEFEVGELGVGGEIGDAGVDGALGAVFGVFADVECCDGEVVGADADAVIRDLHSFIGEFAEVAGSAIAEEVDFGIFFIADERVGELEGLGEAGGGIGDLAIVESAAEIGFVGGGGLFDFGVGAGEEDEHLFLVFEAVD